MNNRSYERQESQRDSAEFSVMFGGSALPGSVGLGSWRTPTSVTAGCSSFPSPGLFCDLGTLRIAEETNNWSRQTVLSPGPPCPEPPVLNGYERQMTQFAVEEEEDLKGLRKEYVLIGGPSVEVFLRSHRSLIEVLLDAATQIRASFGADIVLQLRLSGEEGEVPNLVYGVIQWSGSLETARAALDAFDESWWIENVRRASGRIVFDYELV